MAYSPKRMEEIFLHGPIVDDFLCGKTFIDRMYQKHGKANMKEFVERQPFEKDDNIKRILGCILSN